MNFFSKRLFVIVLTMLMGATAPRVAQADLFADVINAAAKAGGWPADLPEPTALIELIGVAQECADASGVEGVKVCVDAAANSEKLGPLFNGQKDKIDLGFEVYTDLVQGDYLSLLERLGKTAGCAAAMVLTGVPVCALADLIASVATVIGDIAGEVLELMSNAGAQAVVSPEDFYDIHWYPKAAIGTRIKQFKGEYDWGEMLAPMYSGCYDFFEGPGHKSPGEAKDICNDIRGRFTNEVNAMVAQELTKTRALIGTAWDKNAVAMHKTWDPKCFQSTGVVDAEAREDACMQKVVDALAIGRDLAIEVIDSCKVPAEFFYDIPKCLAVGAESERMSDALYAAVTANQQAEAAFKKNLTGIASAMANEKAATARFNEEVGPWMKQCPGMFHDECRLALRKAWDACQIGVAKLPLKEFDNDKNQQKVDSYVASCKAGYSKLITDYGLKAFAAPATLKKYDPATRDSKSMQRAQQARDDSSCPMAKISPTPGQPLDFDVFHLKCTDAASYKLCVHSLGGDVRPSAATCGPPAGFGPTPFVGSPCCEAPRLAPASGGRPASSQ